MAVIRFSDRMLFDTGGDYRLTNRSDGLYVIGHGMLCPVDDADEGRRLIADLQRPRGAQVGSASCAPGGAS